MVLLALGRSRFKFARPQHVVEKEGGTGLLTEKKNKMTLHYLFSHQRHGCGDLRSPPASRDEHPQALCGDWEKANMITLHFEVSKRWKYGGGVEWASNLIERLKKIKLGEYLKANIFDPLG